MQLCRESRPPARRACAAARTARAAVLSTTAYAAFEPLSPRGWPGGVTAEEDAETPFSGGNCGAPPRRGRRPGGGSPPHRGREKLMEAVELAKAFERNLGYDR